MSSAVWWVNIMYWDLENFSLTLPIVLQLVVFGSAVWGRRRACEKHPTANSVQLHESMFRASSITASSLHVKQMCLSWTIWCASVQRTLIINLQDRSMMSVLSSGILSRRLNHIKFDCASHIKLWSNTYHQQAEVEKLGKKRLYICKPRSVEAATIAPSGRNYYFCVISITESVVLRK